MDFILELAISLEPPTFPFYNCTWGDNTEDINVPFETDEDMENVNTFYHFHIKHNYASHGEYNATCTLYNIVSSKTFKKVVSTY